MLFSKKNKILVVAAAAALLVVAPAMGRDDGGGGWGDQMIAPRPAPDSARALALADIEPAAGGELVVAAVPKTTGPVSTGKRLGTFDSVAISAGKLPFARKWRGVTGADYAALFTSGCKSAGFEACDTPLALRLQKAHKAAAGVSAAEALEIVNLTVNAALTYSPDKTSWGQGDYWATPAETLARGVGDCEDFAVTKMWLLRSLGFSAEQLQVVVLQDTKKRVYHAILAVHLNGERLILDNLSGAVRTDTAYPSYMPIMSFVAAKSYIHGFETQRSDLAEQPGDLASISPGEGL